MDHMSEHSTHYAKLLVMVALSFAAMYALMYSMVNTSANVFHNLNQFYMAGLMAAPMVAIELFVMGAMYKNKKFNTVLIAGSLVASAIFFIGIRRQTAVSDEQFLRSMIPHHAGAILMCEEANLEDSAIKELCKTIVTGQQAEIDQMTSWLKR